MKNLRKKLTIILAIGMMFTIAIFIVGCGNDDENVPQIPETPIITPTPELPPNIEQTPEPTPEIISGNEMPNFIGMNWARARGELHRLELNLDIQWESAESDKALNEVIETNPPAGTILNDGDTIILYYSDGSGASGRLSDAEIIELWNNFEEINIDYAVDEEMVLAQWELALTEISDLGEKYKSREITMSEFEIQLIELNNTTLKYFEALFDKHNNPFLKDKLIEIFSDYQGAVASVPPIRDSKGGETTVFELVTQYFM